MRKKERMMLLGIILIWNQFVYSGTMFLTRNWEHSCMETKIDQTIPFLPWTICIYWGCYLFWAVNYLICLSQERKMAWQFFLADILAKTVCLFCFLIVPTTNIRPEIVGNTFWERGMLLLYQMDMASNLFPSIHCLVSWLCFIGVRGKTQFSTGYKLFSCVMALSVCFSTLTTKQHVIADVFGGIFLAEMSNKVAGVFVKKVSHDL